MKLVIAEKPSVAMALAAVLGADEKKDGYLEGGGYLVSCSCSQHVGVDQFVQMINQAARDSRRKVRLVELRTQAHDHPIQLASPETQYLKCAILQVYPV